MKGARSNSSLILLACLAGFGLVEGTAWAQHSDILLGTRDGSLAVVGDSLVFPARFFGAFTDGQGRVNQVSTNPGFLGISSGELPDGYATLPGDSLLNFSILSFQLDGVESANLWHWNAVDDGEDGDYSNDVNFTPVDNGSAFWAYRGSVFAPFESSGFANGEDLDVPGIDLDVTSPTGGLHDHPRFGVVGTPEMPPELGMYLISFGLESENLQGVQQVYLALYTGDVDTAASEAAIAWADSILSPAEPGDSANFNGDSFVDGADLNVWQTNYGGQGATLAQGDANGDSSVDGADFMIWQQQFDAAPAPVASVPEPTSLIVLTTAALTLSCTFR